MSQSVTTGRRGGTLGRRAGLALRRDWQLWVLMLPALAFFVVFCYFPMYGVQIAFRDYKAAFGITGSQWVGLKYFEKFFSSYYCGRMFANTFLLNLYGLIFGFPIPILLAILLNQLNHRRFKGFAQTAIYVPHFISTVVLAGMIYLFFSPTNGIINHLITAGGGKSIYFIMEPGWFRPLFIGSEIWQNAGWNTILYIATLTSIDPQLYEAATIDGATRWNKIVHIDIPHLIPIAVMMLILNCGSLLSSNTDKALLLQTSGNMAKSDILGVYVYNVGIAASKAQYSYASAIGLCLNVINFVIIMLVNAVSRRMSEISLF
ncbi:MAG: sugar ABC transporter permease [Clostridia bacterium]|nr:sugar ABC transporter permease [Clostridia bacterium]